MPLALDPRKRYWIVLKCDQDLPADKQPRFKFRQLTSRQAIAMSDLFDKRDAPENGRQYLELCQEILCQLMLGWENLIAPDDWPGPEAPGAPIIFDRATLKDRLQDILGVPDLRELVETVMDRQKPEGEEKKGSGSPLPSVTEPSAKDAAASADASISQGRGSPIISPASPVMATDALSAAGMATPQSPAVLTPA